MSRFTMSAPEAVTPDFQRVAVIGAGAMGRGIAQIASQAGAAVLLYDTNPDACEAAKGQLFSQWDKLLG